MNKTVFASLALIATIASGIAPILPTDAAYAQSASERTSGTFRAGPGKSGEGRATLVRNANGSATLTFTNFDVSWGPDLRVWLSNADTIRAGRDVTRAQYIEIGDLKDNDGNQSYTIPASALRGGYDQVVIWCSPFSVLFAHAKLS